jgi:hypothetical protein
MMQAQQDDALRGNRLISSQGRSVIINDWERLQKEGYHNPEHLRQHGIL